MCHVWAAVESTQKKPPYVFFTLTIKQVDSKFKKGCKQMIYQSILYKLTLYLASTIYCTYLQLKEKLEYIRCLGIHAYRQDQQWS